MKGTDTEAIFSVVCSSDILEQRNIIKRLWHLFRLVWFVQTTQTCPSIEWCNPLVPSFALLCWQLIYCELVLTFLHLFLSLLYISHVSNETEAHSPTMLFEISHSFYTSLVLTREISLVNQSMFSRTTISFDIFDCSLYATSESKKEGLIACSLPYGTIICIFSSIRHPANAVIVHVENFCDSLRAWWYRDQLPSHYFNNFNMPQYYLIINYSHNLLWCVAIANSQ